MNRRKRLAFQLALRYALSIVVAFALVFLSFYGMLSHTILRERVDVLNQRLSIIVDNLDNRLDTVMALQSGMLRDEALMDALKIPRKSASLSAELARYRTGSYLFNAVYLFNAQCETVGVSRPTTVPEGIDEELLIGLREFKQSYAFRRFLVTSAREIYFLFSIYPPEHYQYIAYGAAEINRDRLFFEFSREALDVFYAVTVMDQQTTVTVIDPVQRLSESGMASARQSITIERTSDTYPQWSVQAFYDQRALISASLTQLGWLLAIFLLTVAAVLAVSQLMARRVTRPAGQLLKAMAQLEQGEYPPPLPVRQDDEIGSLIRGFNHAVSRLSEMNQRVLEGQQEKRRYEVQSLQAQLDLLQSQINPHFIHNTLNTLHFMALRDGNRELAEVITSFNALLRASLGNTSDFSTVAEEVEYVRQYMMIQRHRYADHPIACSYDVDNDAEDALLPRLILQPLVENSLFHGILPNAETQGRIDIICRVENGRLSLAVSDNGVGMSEARLRQIEGTGEYTASNSFNRIGIRNVRERLNLLYHGDCRFDIVSAEGQGTTITFVVPYRR